MSGGVQYWFARALDFEADERRAFLAGNCEDEAVRAEVLSLIQYDVEDLTQQVPVAVRNAMKQALTNTAGNGPVSRVGVYELGRLLGSGGMGFVYEAHRADGHVHQRVAVKFAQVSPMASDTVRESIRRRFVRERQVLASLRHPYIAGLIDAGTLDDGSPYAVIEQVDGNPIDNYCDHWLPDRADRIRLVLKLCEAVQFAHRNLVVHSDIKPENVLVTEDGNPKLIDFGIASDLADDAAKPTLRGFTPAYASPEQCLGLPATVATDVYGLGAVLYRLLTGVPPRQSTAEPLDATIRLITTEDVLRPSAIRPELKGDLENILMKALQREPGRRYGSVPEFVEDLNRYLSRRPVLASPDSIFYRGSRFVRRHWIMLAAGVMFAAALIMTTAVSRNERHEAVRRAADTRRMAERLLFEVHDEIGNAIGGTRAREKLGEIAVQYLEGLEGGGRPDPELAWELLNAYSRLAQSRGGAAASLGDTRSASQFATKALALGSLVENAAPGIDRLEKLFVVYDGLASLFLGAERRAEQREAVDRMLRIAPSLGPLREAQAFKQLARFHDMTGNPHNAAEAWARALHLVRTVTDTPATTPEAESQLISTLAGYGRAQSLAGDFAGAVSTLHEAIALSSSRMASNAHTAKAARQLYWSHIVLGDALGSPLRFSLGKTAEAVGEYRKAQAIARDLLKFDPANDVARLDLARAFSREGVALAASQPALALAALDRSRELASQTSPRNASGLEEQFAYLTSSVPPLVELRQFEKARAHVAEARRLAKEMRKQGLDADEKALLKADAVLLNATGRRLDALHQTARHLALLPKETLPVLSENYAVVEVLERMRMYSAGLDAGACASASARLVRIWSDLRAAYPGSTFVRGRAEQAQASQRNGCEAPASRVRSL